MQSWSGSLERLGCALALFAVSACGDEKAPSPGVGTGSMNLPEGHDAGATRDAGALHDAGAELACEAVDPSECPDPSLDYASVEPIFQARCVTCHNGKTEQWPLTTYQNIADWYDAVRTLVLDCAMPPPESGLTISTEERNRILA